VSGAQLTGPDQVAAPGETLAVPLVFTAAGSTVSAIQFDLDWDPQSLSVAVVVGQPMRSAAKAFYSNAVVPHGLRCLIAGMNQQVIGDGTLLTLFVSVSPQATAGPLAVTLRSVLGASPAGDAVAVSARGIQISLDPQKVVSNGTPAVLNGATMLGGPIAPGEAVALIGWGTFLNPAAGADYVVTFNGITAPLPYVGISQTNAIVPLGVVSMGPASQSSATLELRISGKLRASATIPVAAVAPGIFTADGSGAGAGAILNGDYSLNSDINPAARGSIVMVFGTGFGPTDPPGSDGLAGKQPAPLTHPVTAKIGGVEAEVVYAGAAPGLLAGITQINLRVPFTAPPGNAAPLAVCSGGVCTQAGVTVAIANQ